MTSNCPQLAARDGVGLSRDATEAAGTLLCLSIVSASEANLLKPNTPAHATARQSVASYIAQLRCTLLLVQWQASGSPL